MTQAGDPIDVFWLQFGGDPLRSDEPQHVFCGAARAECPNCARPLLQYARLDAGDERLSLQALDAPELPLLFCWRCALAQAPFHYRLESGGTIALTRFERGPVEADFPYPDYPAAFPAAPLRLVPVAPDDARILRFVREGVIDATEVWRTHPDLVAPRHHAASAPQFLTAPPGLLCSTCTQPMRFLAGFGDANLDARGFVGEETVQVLFHLCAPCAEIGVVQVCD